MEPMKPAWWHWFLAAVPLATIFGASALLRKRTRESWGSTLVTTPPPVVFGVVWSVLTVLTGVGWVLSARHGAIAVHTVYILFLLAAVAYLVVRSRGDRRGSAWALGASLLGSGLIVAVAPTTLTRCLAWPQVVWLVFALNLQMLEAEKSRSLFVGIRENSAPSGKSRPHTP